jgi:hypothetical protein
LPSSKLAYVLLVLPLAVIPAVEACSSSSGGGSPASDGGAMDASATDASPSSDGGDGDGDGDGGGNVDSAASGCPTYTGSSAYCQAGVTYCNTCSQDLTSCAIENYGSYCMSVSGVYQPSLLSALAACAASAPCAASDAGTSPCVVAALAAETPSAAQQQVATDYCSHCPGTSGTCTTDFFDVPTDGGAPGAGYFVLFGNDTLATNIDTTCANAALADAGANCEAAFVLCSAAVVKNGIPPNPCGDAGFAFDPATVLPIAP